LFGQIPGHSRFLAAVQNAAHAPAFFALSLIVLRLLRRLPRREVATFVICVLLGAGIEILQSCIGGDGELGDLLTDAIGTVAGLAGAAWMARHSVIHGLIFLTMVGTAAAPVVWGASAYVHRRAEFPTLAAFDSPLDLYFFQPKSQALQLMPGGGLRVRLPKQHWPGLALADPWPDWSGYRTLIVDFSNPQSEPLHLTIRIHDRRHNQRYNDRFNRDFVLPPRAPYRLKIALADIQSAPQSRCLDLRDIAELIIFGAPQTAGREFVLERIRLE
jgi:hypothetical protein